MNIRQHRFTLTDLDTSATKVVKIDDWQNLTERLFRGVDYGAVNLSQTLPIKFPRKGGRTNDEGGYYWILDAKDLRGVKTRIQVDIERLNNSTNDYENSFTGVLDLRPKGGFNKQDEFVECKVLDSGKFAKFSARDELNYNVFSLVSSDNVTISDFSQAYWEALYKSIDVYLKCVSSGDSLISETRVGVTSLNSYTDYNGVLSTNEIGDRVSIDDPAVSSTIYTNDLDVETTITSIDLSATVYLDLRISEIVGQETTTKINFVFERYSELDVLLSTVTKELIVVVETGNFDNSYSNGVDFDVFDLAPIPVGGYLNFRQQVFVTINEAVGFNIEYTSQIDVMSFSFYEKTDGWPDNNIRGLYAYEVLSRLIQLMTSETNTSKLILSTITGRTDSEFQTYPSDGFLGREFFNNGFLLRQLNDKALNLNFKDSIKSLNSKTPIGVWYDKSNDWFQIEDIEQFYLSELYSFDLGQVKDIKTTDFTELYFNKITTGYPKTEYEDFQGVNEVNTQTEHEISIEEKQTYDIRSPYYGDSKGQEFARRKNISLFASEDTKYDNNVYVTTLNTSDETIQGDLSNLSGYEGVEQDYNLTKTPRQNLQRHFKIIQAPLYKDTNEIFTFRNSVKDTDIEYTDPETSTLVSEFDNLDQYAIENNIVDPELDEFEFPITEDMANEFVANPHKIIPYRDRENNRKYGYIWELTFNRYKKEATVKAIKANSNRIP